MSGLTAFLQTELLALSNEARRRHPEIKEAAERVLNLLRSFKGNDLATELGTTDETVRPFLLACETKQAKLQAISTSCLQKLIMFRAISETSIYALLKTLNDVMTSGVDIQLKILQIVLPLVTTYQIHGELLAQALLLCFKLHEAKIAVVNNTAAATLRQLVILLFDRVATEEEAASKENDNRSPTTACAQDAYLLFQDLCLLTRGESPIFLKLHSLSRTFGLELIESVLTNHYRLFRENARFTGLLQKGLCPFIIRNVSEKHDFPQTMRLMRIVYILLKNFNDILRMECEVFLSRFVKLLEPEYPSWQRVLSLEIFRGICVDGALMRSIYRTYDQAEGSTSIFQDMISALGRLAAERPSVIGANAVSNPSMISSPTGSADTVHSPNASGNDAAMSVSGSTIKIQCIDQLDKTDPPAVPDTYMFYLSLICLNSVVDGMAAFVLPTHNPPKGPNDPGPPQNLTPSPSNVELPNHPVNEDLQLVRCMANIAWPGLLAVFSFFLSAHLDEQLFQSVLRTFQNITNICGVLGLATPRDAFLTSICKSALPSYVDRSIAADQPSERSLTGTTLTDKNIACLRVLLNVAHFLGNVLHESWYLVLETLQQADQLLFNANPIKISRPSPKKLGPGGLSVTTTGVSGNAAGPGSGQHRGSVGSISGHNVGEIVMQSLHVQFKKLFELAATTLDDAALLWFARSLCRLSANLTGAPFEADAGAAGTLKGLIPRLSMRTGDRSFAIEKLREIALTNIPRFANKDNPIVWEVVMPHLIDTSNYALTPQAIRMHACSSALDIVSMSIAHAEEKGILPLEVVQMRLLKPLSSMITGRHRSCEVEEKDKKFCTNPDVQKLALETLEKILQTSGHSLSFGWSMIFGMIKSVCTGPADETDGGEIHAPVSSEQAAVSGEGVTATAVMLKLEETVTPLPSGTATSPQQTPARAASFLIRVAFSCLQLICTDYLALLSPDCLWQCIDTLGTFGLVPEDINISLTAIGLLWNMSDYIQTKRQELRASGLMGRGVEASEPKEEDFCVGKSPQALLGNHLDNRTSNVLWLLLLLQLSNLCSDPRPEVRNGANQTLFRTIGINGQHMTFGIWETTLWKVLFPLLEGVKTASAKALKQPPQEPKKASTSAGIMVHHSRDSVHKQWDETKVLALSGVVSIFRESLETLTGLQNFEKAWQLLLACIRDYTINASPEVAIASIKAMKTLMKLPQDDLTIFQQMELMIRKMWAVAWEVWENMGMSILESTRLTAIPPRAGEDGTAAGGNKQPETVSTFNQQALTAFVTVFDDIYSVISADIGIDGIRRLLDLLYGLITYPDSGEYPSDIESISPLQAAVLLILQKLDKGREGPTALAAERSQVSSAVLTSLAHYVQLAFLPPEAIAQSVDKNIAASSAAPSPYAFRQRKAATYIALSKQCFKLSAEIFAQHQDDVFLFNSGVFESVIKAFAVPIGLKYQCPEGGKSCPALWKAATKDFVKIVSLGLNSIYRMIDDILDERLNEIWAQLVAVVDGALLNQKLTPGRPPEDVLADEDFDLEFLSHVKQHVVARIGHERVHQEHVTRFVDVVQRGSKLYTIATGPVRAGLKSAENGHANADEDASQMPSGTVASAIPVAKEKLALALLDMLFWMCSDEVEDLPDVRRRVALVAAPVLLERCESVLSCYTLDRPLYGRYPFPRIRTDEITFVLKRLADVQLLPGILSVTDGSRQIKTQILSGNSAHLFYLYPALCDTITCQDASVIALLRQCLKKIGSGLGIC